MNFSVIKDNPIILLSWVTAFGLIISLTEATLKLRYERIDNRRKKERFIKNLYPKNIT
tara:strand:- start:470 stop:643 length:174 start_codon:yes stop_codon:yes gene_type:complete